jgi:hypothetical protein
MNRSQLNKSQKDRQDGHSEKEMSVKNVGDDHGNPLARN